MEPEPKVTSRENGWWVINTQFGDIGPYVEEQEAWSKYHEYCRWLAAMDAN